ncbi:NINE protein [Longispora albida]|uniref:NINE protein n=1 Tax=Longispora albida TaxID=203523 RepID=UPI001FE10E8B|nr:NINE protein [Longispora albida]
MSYNPPPSYDPYGNPISGPPVTGGPYGAPPAGFGMQQPYYGPPISDKSKLVAGLLQLLLGGFGVGRFYTGHVGMAIGQIAVTWLTCGFGVLWPLIDGIILLVSGGTDAQGRRLKD